jgi:Family of unknown function (DUF6011)
MPVSTAQRSSIRRLASTAEVSEAVRKRALALADQATLETRQANATLRWLAAHQVAGHTAPVTQTPAAQPPAAPGPRPGFRQLAAQVPAGKYATASRTGSNDLDFWVVSKPEDGKWKGHTFVDRVIGGHDDQPVRGIEAAWALEAILAAGTGEAASRYADELGLCRRCHRHLTDDESRARKYGPDCWLLHQRGE